MTDDGTLVATTPSGIPATTDAPPFEASMATSP
jgi:hypothetical protein